MNHKQTRMTFDVEYYTDDSFDHRVSGDNHTTDTLYQHVDESDEKFACRVVDFINECATPITKITSVFKIDELDKDI